MAGDDDCRLTCFHAIKKFLANKIYHFSRLHFCLDSPLLIISSFSSVFQNAILHNFSHFSQNSVFIGCRVFSLVLAICFSWYLHLKLSHEFLAFISFNIWRCKCKSISVSYLELVDWKLESQMVFSNIQKATKWLVWT